MRLVTIVNTKFHDEKNFETNFANWESEITKFEIATNKILYEEIKVGLLIAGTLGKLHDHLCLTVSEVIDYDQVRSNILHCFKSKSLILPTRRSHYDDPMDVGKVGKGKGDYNGKGKGKGKNDYKGKCKSDYKRK